jgi:hypothetical protein
MRGGGVNPGPDREEVRCLMTQKGDMNGHYGRFSAPFFPPFAKCDV